MAKPGLTAGDSALCKDDRRKFAPSATAELMGGYTENPLVIKKVFRPMQAEFGTPRIWEMVCPDCAITRIMRVIDEHSNQRSTLTDDEERYGDMWE